MLKNLKKLKNFIQSRTPSQVKTIIKYLSFFLVSALSMVVLENLNAMTPEDIRGICERMLNSKIPGSAFALYTSQLIFSSHITALGIGIGTGNLLARKLESMPLLMQQAAGSSKKRKFFQIFNQATMTLTVAFIIGTFFFSYSNIGTVLWSLYSIPSKGNILVYCLFTVVMCVGLLVTAVGQWQSIVAITAVRLRVLGIIFTNAETSVRLSIRKALELRIFCFAHVYSLGATCLITGLPDLLNFLPFAFNLQVILALLLLATVSLKSIDKYLVFIDRIIEKNTTHDYSILVTDLDISSAKATRGALRRINTLLRFGTEITNILDYRAHRRYFQNLDKASFFRPKNVSPWDYSSTGKGAHKQHTESSIKKFKAIENWQGSFKKIPFELDSIYILFWAYGVTSIYTHPTLLLILHKYTINNFLWVYVYAKESIVQNNFSIGFGDLVAFLIPGVFFAFLLGVLLLSLYFGNFFNSLKTLTKTDQNSNEQTDASDYCYILSYLTFLYLTTLELSVIIPGSFKDGSHGVNEFCAIMDVISNDFVNKGTPPESGTAMSVSNQDVAGGLNMASTLDVTYIKTLIEKSTSIFTWLTEVILAPTAPGNPPIVLFVMFFTLTFFWETTPYGGKTALHAFLWTKNTKSTVEFLEDRLSNDEYVPYTAKDIFRNISFGAMFLVYTTLLILPVLLIVFDIVITNTVLNIELPVNSKFTVQSLILLIKNGELTTLKNQLCTSFPGDVLNSTVFYSKANVTNTRTLVNSAITSSDSNVFSIFFVDGISLFLIWLTGVVCFSAQIFLFEESLENFSQQTVQMLFVATLAICCFHTADLLLFFVSFEAILLPLFFMIGMFGSRPEKVNGAFFLLIYTLVGSLFLWPTLLYFIVVLKTTNFFEVVDILGESSEGLRLMVWCCLFTGFAFKVPIVPVHLWLTVAHVEAPTVGSMLLAGLILKLGGYGIVRFACALFNAEALLFNHWVIGFCCLGYTWATIMATRQADIKRFVAYTSISHMNFALGVLFSLKEVGFGAFCHTMISHGLIATGLFGLVGFIYKQTASRDVVHLTGLANNIPFFAICWFIFSMANVGLPFFSGFPGEFFGLTSLLLEGRLAVLCFFFGFYLSAVYAFVVVSKLLYGTSGSKIQRLSDLTVRVQQSVGLLGSLSLLLGLAPGAIFSTSPLGVGAIYLNNQDFFQEYKKILRLIF